MAGVPDPTPDLYADNLGLLVDSLNAEARLNADGAEAVTAMLAVALSRRIQISYWWDAEPLIREQPVPQPLFLTGLPRSGTTYFQYLFDREPSRRMMRTWEGDYPCPPPAIDPESTQRRRMACTEEHRQRRKRDGGEHDKFHLSDPDGPQECVLIMDQTFGNAGNFWPWRVPTYFNRLFDTIDLKSCYEHHKRQLQVLQWQAPAKHWALKWPCHLIAFEQILQVYPDALFVVTHRDPVAVLASNCSYTTYLRGKFSNEVDGADVGRQMKDMLYRHIKNLVDFDAAAPARLPIAHVDYTRVVEDPETVMTEVYDRLGIEFTPSVRQSVALWRAENPPGKRGVHTYDLSDYGLDAREVAEEFAFYTERFDMAANIRT
jgi:hypothetical protein